MAEVKWIKITTDIFDDEKILLIESMPDAYAIITVWFKLLCLAGKMNNSGVFMMSNRFPYTDKMLATIFRMKESTVQLALTTFEQFGMVELVDGIITIPNWDKHQSLDAYEKMKERDRLRKAERRRNQRALAGKPADIQTAVSQLSEDASVDCPKTHPSTVAVSDKEEEKEEDKKEKKNLYSSVPELDEAICQFVEFRKKVKKPMTDRAIELLIIKLKKLSADTQEQIDILNQSILNGWAGIFPLKGGERDAQHSRADTGGWGNIGTTL